MTFAGDIGVRLFSEDRGSRVKWEECALMDPEQVARNRDGILTCRQCGFTYDLSPADLVLEMERGLQAVRDAVTAASPERLDRRPEPDVWSVNAYVAHLAVAAEVITGRVRLIAAEENPFLPYYQQDDAAAEDAYDRWPADASLRRLEETVQAFRQQVNGLGDDAWRRTGIHEEAGEVSLADIAHDMPHELLHHAEDIRRVGGAR